MEATTITSSRSSASTSGHFISFRNIDSPRSLSGSCNPSGFYHPTIRSVVFDRSWIQFHSQSGALRNGGFPILDVEWLLQQIMFADESPEHVAGHRAQCRCGYLMHIAGFQYAE